MPALKSTFTLIANPAARAGRARVQLPALVEALELAGAEFRTRLTEGPGHATELVRQELAKGTPGVAIVGGDGTINEAVNGFFTPDGTLTDTSTWLGLLPCGTGGDFRKTVHVSNEIPAMVQQLMNGQTRRVDVGFCQYMDHDGEAGGRAFINIGSFGVSGLVNQLVESGPKWLGGKPAFFIGTLQALLKYHSSKVRVSVDGHARESRIVNVAIANGQFFGGGMHIAPEAKIDDGEFDVVSLEQPGLMPQIRLARHVYGGTALHREGVHYRRGKVVLAEPLQSKPVLIELDGETPGRLPATFEVHPGAIALRT